MRCDEYEILIAAYADGELDGPETTRVQTHIGQCESCRRLYEEMTRLQCELADVLKECPAVPDLVSAVAAGIPSRSRFTFAWALAAAAAIAVIAVYGYVVLRPIPGKRPLARPSMVRHDTEPARREAPKAIATVQPGQRLHQHKQLGTVRRIAVRKTSPVMRGGPSPISVDTPQVVIEYTDTASVTERTADLPAMSPGPIPNAGPGRQVVAETDVVTENGVRRQRVCYRIIDSPEEKRALNEPHRGEQNGTN
jgi:anti-sigma factor RsiW